MASCDVRRIAVIMLAILTMVSLGWTLLVWDAMRTEEQLGHEVGDDTAAFAVMTIIGIVVTAVLALATGLTWRWQNLKRRWRADRQMLREARRR